MYIPQIIWFSLRSEKYLEVFSSNNIILVQKLMQLVMKFTAPLHSQITLPLTDFNSSVCLQHYSLLYCVDTQHLPRLNSVLPTEFCNLSQFLPPTTLLFLFLLSVDGVSWLFVYKVRCGQDVSALSSYLLLISTHH